MQLDSLSIHAFRGLRDLTLSDLGRVNLIVGTNDSGKTSILEAIGTFCQPLQPTSWIRTAMRRDDMSVNQLDSLEWLFPHQQIAPRWERAPFQGTIWLSGEGSYQVRHVRATFEERPVSEVVDPEIPAKPPARLPSGDLGVGTALIAVAGIGALLFAGVRSGLAGPALEALKDFSVKQTVKKPTGLRSARISLTVETSGAGVHTQEFELWDELPLESPRLFQASTDPHLPTATLASSSHRSERLQIQRLSEAALEGFRESVVNLLQLLDPEIRGVEILDPGGTRSGLYIDHGQTGLAPISVFGDGVRRALAYALALPLVQGGTLLIDETDTAIHASVQGEVFRWLLKACQRYDIQLFATTHSLEAVDAILAASKEHLDQIVAYQLQPGKPPKRFGGEMLNHLRYEMGLDIRGRRS